MDWIGFIGTVSGWAAAIFGWWKWRSEKERRRLEVEHLKQPLRQRQEEFYRRFRECIMSIIRSGTVEIDCMNSLSDLHHESPFIFGDDVQAMVDEARLAAIQIHASDTILHGGSGRPGADARRDHSQRKLEAHKTISRVHKEMQDCFLPYLKRVP